MNVISASRNTYMYIEYDDKLIFWQHFSPYIRRQMKMNSTGLKAVLD